MNVKNIFPKFVIVLILLVTIYIITDSKKFKQTENMQKLSPNVKTFFTYSKLEESLCEKAVKVKTNENSSTSKGDCPERGIVSMFIGGRTGNQLWNYASIWAVARHTGLSGYTPICNMDTIYDMFENLSLPTFQNIRNCPIESNQFVEHPEEWKDTSINVILKLYHFQKSIIFKNLPDVLREFTFKKSLQDKAQNVLRKFDGKFPRNKNFVGVHVRRTDYQEYLKRKYQGTLVKPQFFLNAMKYFRQKYQNCLFVYISDDPKWVKKQFGKLKDVEVASSEKKPNSPAEDLAIMAACNHSIFDYGSFGEWGAILAGGETIFNNMTENQNSETGKVLKWILMD